MLSSKIKSPKDILQFSWDNQKEDVKEYTPKELLEIRNKMLSEYKF